MSEWGYFGMDGGTQLSSIRQNLGYASLNQNILLEFLLLLSWWELSCKWSLEIKIKKSRDVTVIFEKSICLLPMQPHPNCFPISLHTDKMVKSEMGNRKVEKNSSPFPHQNTLFIFVSPHPQKQNPLCFLPYCLAERKIKYWVYAPPPFSSSYLIWH